MEITDSKLLDSLKTHPDCRKRVIQVSPIVSRYAGKGTQKNLFEKNFANGRRLMISRSLLSCSIRRSYPLPCTKPYRHWIITGMTLVAGHGRSMPEPHIRIPEKHELSRIVELPSPYHEKKYNDFLRFLQNLSLTDIASINYYFLDSHKDKSLTNEDFVFALIQSRENAGKKRRDHSGYNIINQIFQNPVIP